MGSVRLRRCANGFVFFGRPPPKKRKTCRRSLWFTLKADQKSLKRGTPKMLSHVFEIHVFEDAFEKLLGAMSMNPFTSPLFELVVRKLNHRTPFPKGGKRGKRSRATWKPEDLTVEMLLGM